MEVARVEVASHVLLLEDLEVAREDLEVAREDLEVAREDLEVAWDDLEVAIEVSLLEDSEVAIEASHFFRMPQA